MEIRFPRLIGVASLLFVLSFQSASVVGAPQAGATPEPIWATLNATALANYPGGDEEFIVFIVNSAQPPAGNETIKDMTLTAPFARNFGIGLPATIRPGEELESTIHLEIPKNFTQPSFTANLVMHVTLWNGTKYVNNTITGSAQVNVFAFPSGTSTQTTTQASTGGISSTLFGAGIAVPSIIALILLVLLIRARGGSRRMAP